MATFFQIKRFFRHYFEADTRFGVHSPFVFRFFKEILDDRRHFYPFSSIERIRKLLFHDHRDLIIEDYGAGSKVSEQNKRRVSDIARYSATPPFFCRVLFKMVQTYKPEVLIELGTSLGISTLYLAKAASNAVVHTVEGSENVVTYAKANFDRLKVQNIEAVHGRFEEELPKILNRTGKLDFFFVDGNHRYEPTLDYFNQALQYVHDKSVLVFDDIHWSDEMEKAWNTITQHPRVTLSLDIFRFGIVFFQKDFKEKQHFTLIPTAWKPWKVW